MVLAEGEGEERAYRLSFCSCCTMADLVIPPSR